MAVPGPPSVSTGSATESSVYVYISDGSTGGQAITARQVAYSTTFGSVNDFITSFSSNGGTIGNLSSGTTWSFRARCGNADGWGPWSSTATGTTLSSYTPPPSSSSPPGAPVGLVATNATISSLFVYFQDSSDGGAAITAHQIAYSTTFGSVEDFIVNIGGATSATIGNLTANTTWSFRARAANQNGWGPWSSTATGRTLAQPTVPGPPTMSLSNVTPASVLATITDGSTGGGTITARQVGYSTTFGALTFITDVVGNSKVIDNLTPETTWSFRARVANENGWGAWSSTYTATTGVALPPGVPSNVVTRDITSRTVKVEMTDNGDGGSPILERQIGYSDVFGAIEFVVSIVTGTIITIANLTPNTTWSFRARSRNRFGWSGWSGIVATAKTLPDVPKAPLPVTLSNLTQDSVDAAFLPPTDTGGLPILEMQLGYGLDANTPSTIVTSDGSDTVSGLISGQKYYFWARARNQIGWGPWSTVRSATLASAIYITEGPASKEALAYVNVNGTWRVAESWVKLGGFWRAM